MSNPNTAEEILHKHIDKESMDELSVYVWPDMLDAMQEYHESQLQELREGIEEFKYEESADLSISAYNKAISDVLNLIDQLQED